MGHDSGARSLVAEFVPHAGTDYVPTGGQPRPALLNRTVSSPEDVPLKLFALLRFAGRAATRLFAL
jgi:hypothetical protein